MIARSVSEQHCLLCGIAVADGAGHTANVPYVSIHQARERCLHGPFCVKCGQRKEQQTLPCCECRALITGWSPPLHQELKIQQLEVESGCTALDAKLLGKSSEASVHVTGMVEKDGMTIRPRAVAKEEGDVDFLMGVEGKDGRAGRGAAEADEHDGAVVPLACAVRTQGVSSFAIEKDNFGASAGDVAGCKLGQVPALGAARVEKECDQSVWVAAPLRWYQHYAWQRQVLAAQVWAQPPPYWQGWPVW